MARVQKGVIENIFKTFQHKCINSYGFVYPKYIAEFILEMRKHEQDSHVLVCVAKDTNIWVNDKKMKIKDAPKQFITKSYDEKNKRFVNGYATKIYSGKKPVYRIKLKDGKEVYATAEHKWLTTEGWNKTIEIKNCRILSDEEPKAVESIELVGDEETYDLQVYEYNTFILADSGIISHNCGNNGSGKSMTACVIAKLLKDKVNFGEIITNENGKENIDTRHSNVAYAFTRTSELLERFAEMKNDVLWIDEITRYMSYKEHQKTQNIKFMQGIEIARANKVAFISCAKAYGKVDSQYRSGKTQIVIQMFDWFREYNPLGKSYGAVFCAPPVVESEQRFDLDVLKYAHNIQELRNMCETRPSFCGYIYLPDVKDIISEEELGIYKKAKELGIKESMMQFRDVLEKKEAYEEGRKSESQIKKEEEQKEKLKQETRIIEHPCGCKTGKRKNGIVYFESKCGFHSVRPDKTNEILIKHRKETSDEENQD